MKTDWPKLRLLTVAGAISWLGSTLTTFTTVLRYKDEVGPPGVSAIMLAMIIPTILAAPYGGLLADRVSLRVLVPSLLGVMGFSSLMLSLQPGFGWSLAFLALTATCGTPVGASFQAAIALYAAPEDLPRVNALMQTGNSVGGMLGPGFAGLLIRTTGSYVWPFVIDGLSFWLLAGAVLALKFNRKPEPHEDGEKPKARDGLAVIFSNPLVRALVIMLGVLILSISVLNVGEVFLVMNVLGADQFTYGIVSAGFSLGMVLASIAISRLKVADRRHAPIVVIAVSLLSLFVGVIAFAWHWAVVAVIWFLAGAVNAALNSYGLSMLITGTPDKVRGRVLAALQAVFSSANVISMAIGGVLIGIFQVRTVFLGAGIISAVAVLIFAPAVLRSNREMHLLGDEVAGVAN